MARLPIYEQKTLPGNVRASGADMGSNVGAAMSQMGGTMLEYGDVLMRREETLRGIEARKGFADQIGKDVQEMRSQGNIAYDSTVEGINQRMNQRIDEYVKSAGGRSGAQSTLRNELVAMAGAQLGNLRGEQIKAQYALMAEDVKGTVSQFATDLMYAPEEVDNVIGLMDKDIDTKFAGVFDPNVVAELRNGAKRDLVQSTVQSLHSQGNWQGARTLMQREDIKALMGADAAVKLNLDNIVMERKQVEKTNDLKRNAAAWSKITGKTYGDAEIATLPDLTKMGTVADKMVAVSMVTGEPVSQAQMETITGLTSSGTSSPEARVAQLTTKILGGSATPDEVIEFGGLSNKLFKGSWVMNPQGYQVYQADPQTPPQVLQAMQRVGGTMGGGMNSGATGAVGGTVSGGQPMPGQTVQLDINGQPIGRGVVDASGTWRIPAPPEPAVAEAAAGTAAPRSARPVASTPIMQMFKHTAGAANRVGRFLGQDIAAQVGMGGGMGAQTQQRDPIVQGFINDAIHMFSGDTKILAAEYKDLAQEFEGLRGVFNSPEGAENKAYGIDIKLQSVQQKLSRLDTAAMDKKTANDAREMYTNVSKLREQLGVRVPTNQDDLRDMYMAGKLDVGDTFFTPTGRRVILNEGILNQLFKKGSTK